MKQQNLRRLFRKEGLKVGHALFEFNTPGIGQILNVSGVDFVFLDMEHSGFGMMETKQLIAYLRAGDLPVLVRPPSKSYHHIARVLDVGADGVMLPMVANASEARQALAHLRYPPAGTSRGRHWHCARRIRACGPIANTGSSQSTHRNGRPD